MGRTEYECTDLHEWLMLMGNYGKYTVRPMDGMALRDPGSPFTSGQMSGARGGSNHRVPKRRS